MGGGVAMAQARIPGSVGHNRNMANALGRGARSTKCGATPGPIGLQLDRKSWHEQLIFEITDCVFKDDDIPKIDFYLGISEKRIHVTGKRIAEIANQLRAGWFILEVDDAKVPKGVFGAYTREKRGNSQGTFVFRSGIKYSQEEIEEQPQHMRSNLFRDNPLARGLFVHEFVHAWLHLEGRAIVRLSDEAAGFLAETLYHVRRGSYDIYHKNAMDEAHRRIIETAHQLIRKHRLDSPDSKGKHLNWLQYRALRKAIHAHSAYSDLGPIERFDDDDEAMASEK